MLLLGIIVLPGMDMAFVAGKALSGGRVAGTAALAGIVAGGVGHTILAGLGLGLVLQTVPGLLKLMLLGGSVYLAWIGLSILRSASEVGKSALPESRAGSQLATLAQGFMTCMLNPKAYLFMLAVFPQFVRPERGDVAAQIAWMGLLTAVVQVLVYGTVCVVASQSRAWLGTTQRSRVWLARGVGWLLLVVAAWSAFSGIQSIR
jgi:threonine/homoserine/homoserine lactone efflux protein